MAYKADKIQFPRDYVFTCTEVPVFDADERKKGDGPIAAVPLAFHVYICPNCDNTHFMIEDPVGGVDQFLTLSPEDAERIGKLFINPPVLPEKG